MNRLSTAKRTQVIAALVEGNSINATCRMLDAAEVVVKEIGRNLVHVVLKLLAESLAERKPNARTDKELILKALSRTA